ncbi:hypothetical protein Q0P01_14740, partial [Staphylococcus aureus]|nr:hypothetical protein [Staphylococcus aureus]
HLVNTQSMEALIVVDHRRTRLRAQPDRPDFAKEDGVRAVRDAMDHGAIEGNCGRAEDGRARRSAVPITLLEPLAAASR